MNDAPRYFGLSALGRKLFGFEKPVAGNRAHWMKLPLDFFNNPTVLSLPDSQRLPLIGVGLLCMRRDNSVQFDERSVRRALNLRTAPDLNLYLAQGLIDLDVTAENSDSMRGERREEKRRETDQDPVAAAPVSVPEVRVAKKPDGAPILVVEPSPWNRDAADLWQAEYRGSPPGALFKALKPLVKRVGWDRVRPALVTYLAETPAEYANVAGKFVAAFGTWEQRARGQPSKRVGGVVAGNSAVLDEWAQEVREGKR